jgi:tetratricopeptide (TPR) repeat protein
MKRILLFTNSLLLVSLVSLIVHGGRNPRQKTVEPFIAPPYIELAQQALVERDIRQAKKMILAAQKCWAVRFEQCGFTTVDYQSVSGALYLEMGYPQKAVAAFESVIREQPNRTAIWFYLGQARYQLGEYKMAAQALDKARVMGDRLAPWHILRVQSLMHAEEIESARVALDEGLRQFSSEPTLLLLAARLFSREGFFFTATDFARQYARSETVNCDAAYLDVAQTCREAGTNKEATVVLEEAALQCPHSVASKVRLAYSYAEQNAPLASAQLFESVLYERRDLAFAASEQYRLAGHFQDAVRTGYKIDRERQRIEQLAAIYLQIDAFDTASELLRPLFENHTLNQLGLVRFAFTALRREDWETALDAASAITEASFQETKNSIEQQAQKYLSR